MMGRARLARDGDDEDDEAEKAVAPRLRASAGVGKKEQMVSGAQAAMRLDPDLCPPVAPAKAH
jgi:hypothetical protein